MISLQFIHKISIKLAFLSFIKSKFNEQNQQK